MHPATLHEETFSILVHDLRQPLGNIETGLYYLNLLLDHPSGRVSEQLRAMQTQIAQALQLLHRAGEELRAQRGAGEAARASAPASLPLTKSATAGVA